MIQANSVCFSSKFSKFRPPSVCIWAVWHVFKDDDICICSKQSEEKGKSAHPVLRAALRKVSCNDSQPLLILNWYNHKINRGFFFLILSLLGSSFLPDSVFFLRKYRSWCFQIYRWEACLFFLLSIFFLIWSKYSLTQFNMQSDRNLSLSGSFRDEMVCRNEQLCLSVKDCISSSKRTKHLWNIGSLIWSIWPDHWHHHRKLEPWK